jgi:hypothetical protein
MIAGLGAALSLRESRGYTGLGDAYDELRGYTGIYGAASRNMAPDGDSTCRLPTGGSPGTGSRIQRHLCTGPGG